MLWWWWSLCVASPAPSVSSSSSSSLVLCCSVVCRCLSLSRTTRCCSRLATTTYRPRLLLPIPIPIPTTPHHVQERRQRPGVRLPLQGCATVAVTCPAPPSRPRCSLPGCALSRSLALPLLRALPVSGWLSRSSRQYHDARGLPSRPHRRSASPWRLLHSLSRSLALTHECLPACRISLTPHCACLHGHLAHSFIRTCSSSIAQWS